MPSRFVIAALAVALPSSAFCACVQADLKGSWRFQVNTGRTTEQGRTGIMDCTVNIDGAGALTPNGCVLVDGETADTASIVVAHARPLLVSDTCNVTLGGAMVSGQSDITFTIRYGATTTNYFSNKASLSLAPAGKDVMLGTFTQFATTDFPNLAVTAVRRN